MLWQSIGRFAKGEILRNLFSLFVFVSLLFFAAPQSHATVCNAALNPNLTASYRLLTWLNDRARCVPQFGTLIKMHSGSLEDVVRAIHSVLSSQETDDPGPYNSFDQWCEGVETNRQALLAELKQALPDQYKDQTEQGLDKLLEIISKRNSWARPK